MPSRGRPTRVDGARADRRIWAWLTEAERDALEAVARDSGAQIAVIIREAVNAYVADYQDAKVFSVTGKSSPQRHCTT